MCGLNSDGQFPENRVQKHCQECYRDAGGGVSLVMSKHCSVCSYLDGCNSANYFAVYYIYTIKDW